MYRLAALIKNDTAFQVEHGDLLRQLGHFEEAVAVLSGIASDGYNKVRASKIVILAQCGDMKVRAIT
jgi:hypothetical protein